MQFNLCSSGINWPHWPHSGFTRKRPANEPPCTRHFGLPSSFWPLCSIKIQYGALGKEVLYADSLNQDRCLSDGRFHRACGSFISTILEIWPNPFSFICLAISLTHDLHAEHHTNAVRHTDCSIWARTD